ncbi:caspase family protein [Bradyrhizobium sp. AUGA SZCCT0283]|uniref:caspase family protein n=1 Tax=Bradyrhizobium sp. AUGA SZCCT0283 TaxID=2807671 RepID=UPI001BAC3313|nr:caspase family protein [Bradyrhizobium sp. AUGA SZCCT0283]MBR1277958.1 caspase family protein [Bradyrhizobium sp. AUGA SZCCT0283]
MFRHALFTLMIPAAVLLGTHSASAESRLALVIGQSAYRSVPALPNPANDARAVTQLLTDSGFEVSTAADLSQNQMREAVSDFAGKVAAKGADTVALVFYAGHGLQIDGENFLVPVDIDPKREADIPIQAVRLNDILNTLTSVPSKMRILMLDACRNNPFPDLKTAGGGLALVDAKVGAPGTFLSFSTSPGAVAEDGSGSNSPYTNALLAAGKEQNIPIEETFKRVRLAVNKVTEGRQTPWDSSSLTEDFRFSGASVAGPKPAAAPKKSVAEWTRDLKGKPVEVANELIVADGTDESYEAFAGLFPQTALGRLARDWLVRHRRMVAWNDAVLINTASGYRSFLEKFPDSDLSATARKLELRLRNRPEFTPAVAAANAAVPQNVALAGPTCPCNVQPPQPLKVNVPVRRVEPDPPKKRVDRKPPRQREPDDDVVIVRRPPPRVVYDSPPPVSIGIGIGLGGFGGGRGGHYGDQGRRGGY